MATQKSKLDQKFNNDPKDIKTSKSMTPKGIAPMTTVKDISDLPTKKKGGMTSGNSAKSGINSYLKKGGKVNTKMMKGGMMKKGSMKKGM